MNQDNIILAFLNDFLNIQGTVRQEEKLGWTEAKCKEMDELAQEDHTYKGDESRHGSIQIKLAYTID